MAQEKDLRDITISSSEIRIRRIDIKDLWQALKEGLDDFNAKPSLYFFLCIFYPLFALFLTLFLIGENLLHLIFPMIAGFTLIGPAVSYFFTPAAGEQELPPKEVPRLAVMSARLRSMSARASSFRPC